MEINYPLIVIVVALLVLITAVVWFVFGDQLRRRLRARRMMKAHAAFVAAFDKHLKPGGVLTGPEAEAALSTWKKYMEQLDSKPYTKLTTRETLQLVRDESLTAPLRTIDAAVYGSATAPENSLLNLKGFALQRFNKKMQEVTNG